MPLVDSDDPQVWADLYDPPYTRAAQNMGLYASRAQALVALGVTATDRVLIGGCAYGWLIEALKAEGIPLVWGIENSSHIISNRGTEAVGATLFVEDDLNGGGRIRNALRQLTGARTFDWVVTEDLLPVLNDTEVNQILNASEAVLDNGSPDSQIVHIVTPLLSPEHGQDPRLNWKTLANWQAVRPAHTWADTMLNVVL